MSRKRITIEQWITEALSDQDKGGKACTALSLILARGSSSEEIHTKQLEGATHSATELAHFFTRKATGHAQDLPGIQTFRLLAFYGSSEPQASFPFTVADGDLTGGGELPYAKHESSEKGLLGQLMKHNEHITQMALDLAKTIAVEATGREHQMRQEVHEAQMIVRDVVFNMRKEGHEMRIKEMEFARSTNERQMLLQAMPHMINTVAGREILPQDAVDTSLLDRMAHKVKPEHLKVLVSLGIINQEEAILLDTRFKKTLAADIEKQKALQILPDEDETKGELQ